MIGRYLAEFIMGSSFLVSLAISIAGLAIERVRPVERRQSRRHIALNLGYSLVQSWAAYALTPLAGAASITVVNALGAGLILLPSAGLSLFWAVPLYLLAMDLSEYLFHRAQHAWPFLWAMHSLHHSDCSVNVTTTMRRFWVEAALKSLLVYPFVGLLLRPSPATMAIYTLTTYWNFVAHMNIRLSFGPFWFVLNSPQYHRIHHAANPVYGHRNFVGLFPVYDIIFGTHFRPRKDEYPSSGLASGDAARGLLDAVLWPARRHLPYAASAGLRARTAVRMVLRLPKSIRPY
jgi:sterol desaturase/sphingolipid hydroxylase (fatty acid hydroxylase superfamily)